MTNLEWIALAAALLPFGTILAFGSIAQVSRKFLPPRGPR